MSDAGQPPPYPGQGRPAGPGFDPSSAPTQVGPPAAPPAGAVPPPPVVPPPLAPPPYGQQPWGPPPPRRGGSRVGLVVGLVVLVLLLAAGGGVAAFLLLRDDDSGDTTSSSGDDPSDEQSDEPSDEPTPTTLDPVTVESDLVAVSEEVFPSSAETGTVSALSWSTAPDNLDGDQRRELTGAARAGATEWQVISHTGTHTYSLYVEHIATDYAAARGEVGCDPTVEGSFCEVHTTPAGATAYESVYTYDGGGGHYVWIPGDAASGRPEVTVSESIGELEGEPGDEELIGLTDISVESMLAALDDPRLLVLPPEVLPPLPSFAACVYTSSPPSTCPAGLE